MNDRVSSIVADPEKELFDNTSLSGAGIYTLLPTLPVEPFHPMPGLRKEIIRTNIRIAPVEAPGYKGDRKYRFVRVEAQAARCPVCKILVAVGQSFDQHVFFCRGARP